LLDLLDRFPDAKRQGAGWEARCPAHDDRRASLSIARGEKGWLLECHAGCTVPEIVGRVNLSMADLFYEKQELSKIVATYEYRDEGGRHLFDVVRFQPKDFRQRAADGAWSTKGIRRVLYRLPELQGRTQAVVVEGEKDADRLHLIKLPGTTAPGGASKSPDKSKWSDSYTQQLKAASVEQVIILPDNDEAGRLHADQAARSCHTAGLQVKVVALPGLKEKGDVSDWLDAGHTRAELLEHIKSTPIYSPAIVRSPDNPATPAGGLVLTSIGDLLAEPDTVEDWIVDGLFLAGGTALIAGKPKAGKSTAARAAALSVARGGTWLGRHCEQGTVWYLALEGRRKDIKNHFRQMGATADDPIRIWVGQAPAQIVSQLMQIAEQERPALIVIDTMQRFLKAQSTDDYAEMTTLFDQVIGIAQKSGAAIVLLHHASKADRAGIDAVLGSTAITGSVDTIMLLARTERYRTISTVQRVGEDLPETVILLDEKTGIVRLGDSRQDADVTAVEQSILEVLRSADGPLPEDEIDKRVEARTTLKRKALRRLVPEQVTRTGKGGKTYPYRYTVSGSRSFVPSKEGEQENRNVGSQEIPTELPTDSCSLVFTQELVPNADADRF
jgi:hypothetical protein